MSSTWLSLDGQSLSIAERQIANTLSTVLDKGGATTVQVTDLDEDVQPATTVLLIERPTERLLLVVRENRTMLVATDDLSDLDAWRVA